MTDNNPYQKVFFRTVDEKEQKELVNPWRHGSTSPKQYRRWSPEISQAERNLKKKEREETYIKSLNDTNKPYFLIKNKEVFTNPEDVKQMSQSLQGKYYKVINNTEKVGDIHADASKYLQDSLRKTVVHGEVPLDDPFNIESIYKIEGIEYLPEGFLELEPLLYYDEYFFDDKFDEKRFLEEQRKIKHLRRKQYSQKDVKKKREVTLFVVDKYKDRLVEYLEMWYAQNMRRMKDEEIEYVAKELETDFNTIAQLQEIFLKKKKFENSARLSNYLAPPETRDERISTLPPGLQRHFSNAMPSSGMSKKGSQISQSRPSGLQKGDKPVIVEINDEQREVKEQYQLELEGVLNKIRNSSAMGLNVNLPEHKGSNIEITESANKRPRSIANNKSPSYSSTQKVRTSQAVEDAVNNALNRSSDMQSRGSSSNQRKSTSNQKRPSENQRQSSNQIQSQLRQSSINQSTGNNQKLLSINQTVPEDKRQSSIQNQMRQSSLNNPPNDNQKLSSMNPLMTEEQRQSSIQNQMKNSSLYQSPNENQHHLSSLSQSQNERPSLNHQSSIYNKAAGDAHITFIEVDNYGNMKENSDPIESVQKAPTINIPKNSVVSFQQHIDNKPDSFGKSDSLGRMSKSSASNNQSQNIFSTKSKTVVGTDSSQHAVNRFTMVSKSANGRIFIEQKLKPTLVCNDYYFQIIQDAVDEYGHHKVTVITKNELGEIISSQIVNPDNLGNFHHSVLFEPHDTIQIRSLIIRNEFGNTLCVTPIESSAPVDPSSIHVVMGDDGERKSTIRVTKMKSNMSIVNLSAPQGRGSQSPIGKKSTQNLASNDPTRKSLGHDGLSKASTIVKHSNKPTSIGHHYYQQLAFFASNNTGKQSAILKTINENGEVLFENPVPDDLATESYQTEVISEPIDEHNIKRTINTLNAKGQQVACHSFVVSSASLFETPGKKTSLLAHLQEGERKTTVREMLAKASTVVKHSLKPTLIGNQYYQQIVYHAIGHLGKPSVMVKTINDNGEIVFENHVPTELAGESYITEVVVESLDDGNIRKTIHTINERGQSVASNTFITSNQKLMEDYLADVILEVLDNSNGKQTINVLQRDISNPRKTTKRTLIRTPALGNSFYVEYQQDEMDQNGNRGGTLIAKTTDGKQVAKTTHKPTVMGIIGENYFEDLENAVEQMVSRGTEHIVINPIGENFTIKVDMDSTDQHGKRTLVVSAIDKHGSVLMKKTYKPTINEVLGEHYFDEIIDDIEDTLRNHKATEIKKKSTIGNKMSLMALKHTQSKSVSSEEPVQAGKNAFFVNLINNIDDSRKTIDQKPGQPHFSISLKAKSNTANGNFAQGIRGSLPSLSAERQKQVSFGDPKQSFENQSHHGSLRQSSGDQNKGSLPRNNTTVHESRPSFQGGVISDEEFVRRSLKQGINFNNNKLLLLNPKKSGIIEGGYHEHGRIPSDPIKVAEGTFDEQGKIQTNPMTYKSQKLADNTSAFLKTISSINPHDSLIETNNLILQKSEEMKRHLENYMDSIKQIQDSQINESVKYQERSMQMPNEDDILRAKIYEVFNQEKDKLSNQIYKKLQNMNQPEKEENVMDEFYEFCRSKLPNDEMYKESVLFVSLFYYFLEKKNLIK